MRRRFLSATALGLAVGLLLAIAPLAAQPPVSLSVSDQSLRVNGFLERGRQLETQRRWGEALAYYEDALRLYPEEQSLERRFELTRLHYDLARRYADHSYSDSLAKVPFGKALDLYSQVLLKMQTHYVETPSWKDLVQRGTADLELALGEPLFAERNMPRQDPAAVEAFNRELREALSRRVVATPADARGNVAAAASLAEARLAIPPTAVVFEYLCGATNSLDPYSAFLTADQLNEVYAQIEGHFVGLGVELKTNSDELLIVRVIRGSPAERAGIRGGDRILAIDGRPVDQFSADQGANLLQGPEGSQVTLTVAAPGEPARQTTIRRQRVEVPSVDQVQTLDAAQGIVYLKLTCFQKTTRRDLEDALWQLHREGMRSLIIDLRGNPGGLLISSVEVAERFLDHGVIVATRGRSPQEDVTYTAHQAGAWQVPLTLIIDQDSASAAEIFAGAIHDHHRGTIVGVRSFGKGSVQGIFPLEASDTGLRLTTAKFYSPGGRPYSRVGVEPDVVVHEAARPVNGSLPAKDDAMLRAALDVARNALAAR